MDTARSGCESRRSPTTCCPAPNTAVESQPPLSQTAVTPLLPRRSATARHSSSRSPAAASSNGGPSADSLSGAYHCCWRRTLVSLLQARLHPAGSEETDSYAVSCTDGQSDAAVSAKYAMLRSSEQSGWTMRADIVEPRITPLSSSA